MAENLGTIFIRLDGSIDPPNASIQRIGRIYTITADIYAGIVVQKSHIIIDGNGCTLQGSGSEYGFYLNGVKNVRIEKVNIK